MARQRRCDFELAVYLASVGFSPDTWRCRFPQWSRVPGFITLTWIIASLNAVVTSSVFTKCLCKCFLCSTMPCRGFNCILDEGHVQHCKTVMFFWLSSYNWSIIPLSILPSSIQQPEVINSYSTARFLVFCIICLFLLNAYIFHILVRQFWCLLVHAVCLRLG